MTTAYESLLALDSFTSEESVRVSVYSRALTLMGKGTAPEPANVIAGKFLKFVKGQRWRMEALDVALHYATRRSRSDDIIRKANEIVSWVEDSGEGDLAGFEDSDDAEAPETAEEIEAREAAEDAATDARNEELKAKAKAKKKTGGKKKR